MALASAFLKLLFPWSSQSNEWTGKWSFNGRSLHTLAPSGEERNPYQEATLAIASTLAPFDDDQLIPVYGFGDATTNDRSVFSFFPGDKPCQGLEQVLERYSEIVPHAHLSGPTSFAPLIYRAINIVRENQGACLWLHNRDAWLRISRAELWQPRSFLLQRAGMWQQELC